MLWLALLPASIALIAAINFYFASCRLSKVPGRSHRAIQHSIWFTEVSLAIVIAWSVYLFFRGRVATQQIEQQVNIFMLTLTGLVSGGLSVMTTICISMCSRSE